jgi:RNA polymerase sigma-70 factor (ECF subfamily)
VAWRILRNEADAEDAVQGAHVLALRHLHQFAGRSSFFAWIRTITANEALTQMRSRAKLPTVPGEDCLPYLHSPARNPEQQAIERDMREVLNGALEELPDGYRSVFRLRAVEDMSTTETGRRLGLTEACVKTRLLRARKLLQTGLSPATKRGAAARSSSSGAGRGAAPRGISSATREGERSYSRCRRKQYSS